MKYLISFAVIILRPAEVQLYRRDTKVRSAGFGRRTLRSGVQRDRPKRHGERVYRDVSEASDSASVFVPDVLDGDMNATRAVLKELDIPFRQDWSTDEVERAFGGKR